jgi:hypothetical protein
MAALAIAIVLGGVVLLVVEVRRAREPEPGAFPTPVADLRPPGQQAAGREKPQATEIEPPTIETDRRAPSGLGRQESPRRSGGQAGSGAAVNDDKRLAIDERRGLVGKAYDAGDYEVALERAAAFLLEQPGDEYAKRVAAVSACAIGDEDRARQYYAATSASSRAAVVRRCRRFGVEL